MQEVPSGISSSTSCFEYSPSREGMKAYEELPESVKMYQNWSGGKIKTFI